MADSKLILLEASTPVYFFHEEHGYIQGVIEDIQHPQGKNKTLKYIISSTILDEPISIKPKYVYEKKFIQQAEDQCNLKSKPLNDLLELLDLNEASLQVVVEKRFLDDEIYTFIGPIVLAVNPFKWNIPHVQDDQMIHYMNQNPGLRPHSWSVADDAFRSMIRGEGNQSILVSGISGAGKTEAAKTVTKYLTALSTTRTKDTEKKKMALSISTKIQESSPILEAFGNAKTINNDNSSRFGKFIKLAFDKEGVILGGTIVQYLLERSRVIAPGPNERSYHIFYQLLAGASDTEKRKYKLENINSFPCLEKGNCTKVDSIDDVEDYRNTRAAMNILGITPEEQDDTFTVLSSILHLSRLQFSENANDESAYVKNRDVLIIISELLQIDIDLLEKVLITKKIIIMNNAIMKKLNKDGASDARDALMKALYVNTFDWLIRKINEKIAPTNTSSFIGLLDIFGFEQFGLNSFEQFCINYSNEALQHHYNSINFKKDMKECQDEGIDITTVKFNDNTPCIELIKGSKNETGILSLLDAQCAFPKATDQTFTNLVKSTYNKKHKYFDTNPIKHEEFYIRHFAGKVEYNTNNWLEKNKDELKDDIPEALRQSRSPFVSELVPTPVRVKGKLLTVGGNFKTQLDELLDVINSTLPHWIRCIKPHPLKKPNMFHKADVLNQLRSSGVLATITMRREGFSVRLLHNYFWERFKVLNNKTVVNPDNIVDACKAILIDVNMPTEEAQVGKTKVFMRPHAFSELEKKRSNALLNTAILIQSHGRSLIASIQIENLKKKIRIEKLKIEINRRRKEMDMIKLLKEQKEFILAEIERKNNIYSSNIKDFVTRRKERVSLLSEEKERFVYLRKEKILKKQIEIEERRRAAEERARLIATLEEEKRIREEEAKRKFIEEKLEKERIKKEEEERERERHRREVEIMEKEASIQRRRELERIQLEKMNKLQIEQQRAIEQSIRRKQKVRKALEQEREKVDQTRRVKKIEEKNKRDSLAKEEDMWEKMERKRLRQQFAEQFAEKIRKDDIEREKKLQAQAFLRMEELRLEEKEKKLHQKLLHTAIRRKQLQEKQNEIISSKSNQLKNKLKRISEIHEQNDESLRLKQEHMDLIQERERKLKEIKNQIKQEFDQLAIQRELEFKRIAERERDIEYSLKLKRFENSLERSLELEEVSTPSPNVNKKNFESERKSSNEFLLDLSKLNRNSTGSTLTSARSTSSRNSLYQDFTSSSRKIPKAGTFSLYS